MGVQDTANLALIPAAYKASKLYSVFPTNGDGDFDFIRGSSGTRVNKAGLIETVAVNTPRLDYPLLDGVVQDCPALLLEPSRTNKITYSDNLSSGTSGSTITTNTNTSPTGELNASTINASTSYIAKSVSISSGDNVFSCFLKYNADAEVEIYIYDGSYYQSTFNIQTGAVVSNSNATGSIENYGNGWYRCSIYAQTSSTTSEVGIGALNGATYTFGWQLEAGSYVTSYIKNINTSAGVTRSADVCNGAGTSDTFNDSEGVLFGEISTISDSTFKRISIDSGSYTNSVVFDFDNTNNLYGKVFVGGSAVSTTLASGLDIDNNNKLALKYKSGDYALWVNGFEFDGGTNTNTPTGLNSLNFELGGFNHFYGNTKQVMTFNEALSDTELEDLTSWDSFNEMAKGQLYTIE